MIRIGVRAHDFGRLHPDDLARRIAAKGFSSVQLAVNKAIAGLDLHPGDMTPGLAWHIGQAFQRAGVQIAVLGCYINLVHPDPTARAGLMAYFKDHLRHARDFGCAIVATETASLNADWSPHPDNHGEHAFQAMLRSIAELVEEAEHFGVMVGIEGVAHHVLYSPARIRRLLDTIRSPNLQIVFDPVNLLTPDNYQQQDRVVQESFDLFGDRIAVIHAKDFRPEAGVLRQLRTGQGDFNYRLLMRLLQQRKPGISILLEEANEASAEACIHHIQAAAS